MSSLIDDCKKYLGLPPYDGWTNVCVSDPYFYKSICNKYGEQNVQDAIEGLK